MVPILPAIMEIIDRRGITLLGLSLVGAAALAPVGLAQVGEGAKAPEFAIANARSTGIKNFKALRGKVLMLDFFATW